MAELNELPPPTPDERQPDPVDEGFSPKSLQKAWLLSFFLGLLGVDRFYLEKRYTGIMKLVSVGGLFVWWVVDLWILMINPRDRDALPLVRDSKRQWFMWVGNALVTALVVTFFSLVTDG